MNTKTIAIVFTITVAMSILGSASIAPAFAATKVNETTSRDTNSGTLLFCGEDVNYTLAATEKFTIWDNGHYTAQLKTTAKLTDPVTGKHVGNYSDVVNIVGNVSDLPQSGQENFKTTCAGTGVTVNFHAGYTIHKDGTVTVHHY
jgi:hypothetical protein